MIATKSKSRKVRAQMSLEEINSVETLVHGQDKWRLSTHVNLRMGLRGITWAEVLETIYYGYVVEVNEERRKINVLMRRDLQSKSVCVVVSLDNRRVVTAYLNTDRDHHDNHPLFYSMAQSLLPVMGKYQRQFGIA